MSRWRVVRDNGDHGLSRLGSSGPMRGVWHYAGEYVAMVPGRSRRFLTLGGAVRWLAWHGSDAHGRELT